jgi:hypothetical protein
MQHEGMNKLILMPMWALSMWSFCWLHVVEKENPLGNKNIFLSLQLV